MGTVVVGCNIVYSTRRGGNSTKTMDGGRVPLDLSGMLDFYLVLSFFCAVLGGKRCHVQYVVHFRANSIVHSPILDKTVNSLC